MAKSTGKNQSHKEHYGKGERRIKRSYTLDKEVDESIKKNAEEKGITASHFINDFLKEHLQ